MMTDTGTMKRRLARRVAGRVIPCLVLSLVLAGPGVASADADGRADWRMPKAATRDNAPPVLGGIAPQRLLAGRPWTLHVKGRDPDGERPTLLVRGLPDGARLGERTGGWHRLDWTPPPGTTGEFELTVIAVDARDPRVRSERVVRLQVRAAPSVPGTARVAPPVPAADRAAPSAPEATDVAPPVPVADEPLPIAPRIEPLASRIVSAGRTVSFRVAATLDENAGRAPLLQIDRLPKHASFDENPDGSRTFHWPTGDRDQGEHRFRITASHPDDTALASRVDLLVIVGDPTRAITAPLDEPGPAAAGRSAGTSLDPTSSGTTSDEPASTFDGDGAEADPSPDVTGGILLPDGGVDASVPIEDEPYLPRAGVEGSDYWAAGEGGFDDEPSGRDGYEGAPASREPDDPFFEPPATDYFGPDDDLPAGPDGLPFEP